MKPLAVALVVAMTVAGCGGKAPEGEARRFEVSLRPGTGVKVGTPVRVTMERAGSVSRVRRERKRVIVTLRLLPGTQVPPNARALVRQPSLLGPVYLELAP